jgi:hypothetical protein
MRNRGNNIGPQIQKYLRKHAERKFFETVASQLINITWDIIPLSQNIIQGISGGQRVGDNITYVMLRNVGRITANSTASVCNVRYVIVLDKMNDSVAPVYSDLFLTNAMDSTYSPEQIKAKRFTILMDKSYALNTAGVAAHMFNLKIPLNQTATFNAATSTTAANGKNSMWLFVIADNGANKASLNSNFSIEFIDP